MESIITAHFKTILRLDKTFYSTLLKAWHKARTKNIIDDDDDDDDDDNSDN